MITDSLSSTASSLGLEVKEKKGKIELSKVVAERKAFLSKKKLTYTAWVKIDEEAKAILFSEMLSENASGFTSGDSDMGPGFGFKTETYNTMSGARTGGIAEQSQLFGKQYTYDFDYAQVRTAVEQIATTNGFTFSYQILPSF